MCCQLDLLYNLMPAFKNLIKTKFIPDYEDFHILREQNLINKQTAKWYIDNLLDRSIYKSLIGRETNLRWDDDSGLKNSINIFKEFKLLFSEEGDNVIKKIEEREGWGLEVLARLQPGPPKILQRKGFGAFGRPKPSFLSKKQKHMKK